MEHVPWLLWQSFVEALLQDLHLGNDVFYGQPCWRLPTLLLILQPHESWTISAKRLYEQNAHSESFIIYSMRCPCMWDPPEPSFVLL